MTSTPLSPTVSPVATAVLAEYLGDIEGQGLLLSSLLTTATDAVIRHIGRDLLSREWRLVHWTWPINGTRSVPTLSPQAYSLRQTIELPYATQADDVVVTVLGEPETDFILQDDRLYFRVTPAILEPSDDPALVVEYAAGYGESPDDIPSPIKTAITMLAAFLFEHRGECDADEALKRSGAKNLLAPYRKAVALA